MHYQTVSAVAGNASLTVTTWLLVVSAAVCQPALSQDSATNPAAETREAETSADPEFVVEPGFTPLFDGRLLSGWEGNAAWFRVEQRAIVGGNLQDKIPHNYFLCTTREFGDFDLRLQVKTVGEGANGGIQFRSRRIAGSEEVSGYQADVGGIGERLIWGSLYDESRRRRFVAEAAPEVIKPLVKPDDWNDYRIRCVGPKIELFVNGQRTVEYTEPDDTIPQTGIIGLQIHSGPATEVWYRHLRIKTL